MVDKVFMAPDFPYVSHINFGSIQTIEADREVGSLRPAYGISIEDLELDKKYGCQGVSKNSGAYYYLYRKRRGHHEEGK